MSARQHPIVARGATFPSPVGGWNARDALDAMEPNQAQTLINWFPETTYCRTRDGFKPFCDTGAGTHPVKSLIEWNGGAGSDLLAACNGAVYEVSTGTAASLGTGFGSDVWSSTNFATAAGQYVLMANGVDTPQVYDGATLAATVNTISGSAPTITFSQVEAYAQRIFYVESDSLSVWYLDVGAYQGALTEFDFGALCTRGGSIANISTWTRDNGFGGANEMFVMVTTKGEVLIYTGTDPGGSNPWSLAARYLIGEPVSGPHCVARIGPDMILLGEDGFQPMAQYLQMGESKTQSIAISRTIGNAVTEAVRRFKAEFGWCAVLFPQGNMMMFNIPQGAGVFYQYVVNTITGAWTQFRGMNAYCWCMFTDRPYFGGADGVVYEAATGTADNDTNIQFEARLAYQYVGGSTRLKRFTAARPVMQVTGPVTVNFELNVDFEETSLGTTLSSNPPLAIWGAFLWGDATWGGGYSLQRDWLSANGIGYAVAPHFSVATKVISIRLNSTDILFEPGAYV
jgi:hypothetical protein